MPCRVRFTKIAKAKPKLADNITEKLLNFEGAQYKHNELVQASASRSFSKYFDLITDKEKIINLARELQRNKSQRTKKEAADFLKQRAL